MVDTSIIERKIYSNVMDTCFNAIVVEAFVNGVPIEESEKTDELRDKLSHYAAECLTDLGSSHLLTEALESVKNHTSRLSAPEVAYLKQINSICMETAKSVTARIIEENKGNDDALKEAADKVALTQSEFERFSKAASNVTPDALSKMIQDKTLNTIKEEKEAFQKDAELELEVVNAINAVSEEENPDELPPEMGDVGEPPKEGDDIGQNAAPGNEEPQSDEPADEAFGFFKSKRNDGAADLKKHFKQIRSKIEPIYKQANAEVKKRIELPSFEVKYNADHTRAGFIIFRYDVDMWETAMSHISDEDRDAWYKTIDAMSNAAKNVISKISGGMFGEAVGRSNGYFDFTIPVNQDATPASESFTLSEYSSTATDEIAMEGLFNAIRNGWRRLLGKAPIEKVAKDAGPSNMQPTPVAQAPAGKSSPPISVTNVGKDGAVPNVSKFDFIQSQESYLGVIVSYASLIAKNNKDLIEMRAIGVTGPKNLSAFYFTTDGANWDFDGYGRIAMNFLTMVEIQNQRKLRADGRNVTAYEFIFYCKNGEFDDRGGESGKTAVSINHEFKPIPDPKDWLMTHRPINNDSPIRIANHGDPTYEHYGFSTRKAMESYVGVQKKVSEDAMDSFMKSIAGQNYRRKHASIFSKLQELAYEGILATTESYDSIPFGTMAAITKENTFSKFTSHRTKDLKATMESVSRYNFESMGTPDAPTKEQLSNGLLVASIIYAFFETLNSMNLYCPKLNEIREFVDEAIPIKDRVALDRKQFMDFFRSVIANAQHQLRGVNTVPDVEVIQKDLDVVREHTASPGFDDDRPEINEAIESLQNAIDAKRDLIIKATTQSLPKVEESAYESMMRTTDTLKFTRVANIAGRKSNVASFRCKIDPGSKYICLEALNASGTPVGRNSFALESRIPKDGLVDFVTTAVKSSKLMTCGKRVVVSDKRNGKIYLDTNKL